MNISTCVYIYNQSYPFYTSLALRNANSSRENHRKAMEKYEFIKVIGEGTFGRVCKAIDKSTGETVAVKKLKIKFHSWHEILKLDEVCSLKKMNHPNIVKLKQIICENAVLFFIFEFMESNLHELLKNIQRSLSEAEIKHFSFQVLSGLAHMHELGYFHRDLKPENLLVTQGTIKIADLGLAKRVESNPLHTDIVGTLWYRAPEMVFRARDYDPKVDMWALGVIMAEMFTGERLLPGRNEPDQMNRICKFIGSPNRETWPEGFALADKVQYEFPQFEKVEDLSEQIPNAGPDALSLIKSLCSWNPRDRPSPVEALQHRFFWDCYSVRTRYYSGSVRTRLGPPPGFESKFNMSTTTVRPQGGDTTNLQRIYACCH